VYFVSPTNNPHTCFHVGILLGLISDPEDGGDVLIQNVG
jgi:hypothetical protein